MYQHHDMMKILKDIRTSPQIHSSTKTFSDGQEILTNERVLQHENRSLIIYSGGKADQGIYECEASNEQGLKSNNKGSLNIIGIGTLIKIDLKKVLK